MKIARQLTLFAVLTLIGLSSLRAAPVESVDSARASVASQKVDAFLGEQMVVDQLGQLGLSVADARARLARLDDSQMEQLAAEIDLLQAGGKIRSGHPHPFGPLGCVIHELHTSIRHLIRFLFCWNDIE